MANFLHPTQVATITSLGNEGRGIAHVNGHTVFIDNALPGEEVEFYYLHRSSKYCSGHATNILKKSPLRIAPGCSYFDSCGGCSLQHLASFEQLNFKRRVLEEYLQHQQIAFTKPPSLITGPIWGYRRRARLAVKYLRSRAELLLGFHEKQGSYIQRMEECNILWPTIGRKLADLKQLIASLTIVNRVPQIEIACGGDISAIVLRNLSPLDGKDRRLLEEFGHRHNLTVYCQPGDPASLELIGGKREKLSYSLPEQNLTLFFEPLDFIQINQDINEKLVTTVMELMEPTRDETILDLFCGIGNFTLPLARRAGQVVGVEGSRTAVCRAQYNARQNGLANLSIYQADLSRSVEQQEWWGKNYAKILLDPPRSGAEVLLGKLGQLAAKKIIYVSCNPTTFVRDAVVLQKNNYRLGTIVLADMYPQTKHIELVGEFTRN